MSYTFDCANKVIQLDTTDELDMLDLYSRWKDEVISSIAGCEQVFRVVKEPLSGSVFLGPYYFVMNNWQIRPFDSAHELVVSGTVLQDASSTLSPFKVDDLTNTVSIVRTVAVEVQVVETRGALSAEQEQELSTAAEQSTIARKHLTNRDVIDEDNNTLTRYDDDGTTALTVFDLKNADGAASTTSIFEKTPQ